MGLSASQGRMLLLTARKDDLEFRAQQISQKRLLLSQQLEEVASDYEEATSNRQMTINLYDHSANVSDNDQQRITKNLTYNTLMSGTWSLSSEQSGVVAGKFADNDLRSNVNYRLIDTEGAIVVASESEIPNTKTETKEYNDVSATKHLDKNGVETGFYELQNLIESKGVDGEDSKENAGEAALYAEAKGELKDYFDKTNKEQLEVDIDSANGYVIITNSKGEKEYYHASTGKKATENELTDKPAIADAKATLVSDISKVKGTRTVTTTESYGQNSLKKGEDGKYRLYDKSGKVINTYVVDKSLTLGTTDAAGKTSGPNYLQDCLRNGKYSLQTGKKNEDSGEFEWRNTSWDSTSNIYDRYYSDDDDAAKAKYDRLQTQIQAQDKKLELELDNIETQRTAVTTEIESIEKVIKDNVDKTFKTFA